MAILNNVLTISKKIDRMDPRSAQLTKFFVELLDKDTAILDTLPTIEANNLTSHQHKERVSLPTVSNVAAGQGAIPSASETANKNEEIKIFKSIMNIDKESYELGGQGKEYVKSEMIAHIAAQDISVSSGVFYGSNTDTLQVKGLANRYNSLSGNIADNVISAGSVSGGDATSIYVMGIGGQGGAQFVYPKGSPSAGFERTGSADWTPVTNSSGEVTFQMFMEFCINRGLLIPDWRTTARICNIDKSALMADPTGATINIPNLVFKAVSRLPSMQKAQYQDIKIFMNRSVKEMLDVQLYNKGNAYYTQETVTGKIVNKLCGYEVMVTDSIVNTETTVS